MATSGLTLCLLTAPDETGLAECLASARGAVDHLLVGCTGTKRDADRLTGSLGIPVIPIPWRRSFAGARNQLMARAGSGWVLILDADERLALDRPDRLRMLIAEGDTEVFALPVQSPQGDGRATVCAWQARLYLNRPACQYSGIIGERLPFSMLAQAQERAVTEGVRILHLGLQPGEAERRAERNLAVLRGRPLPVDPHAAVATGNYLLCLGRAQQALERFAAASGEAPDWVSAQLIRGQGECLAFLDRAGEALALLEEGCRSHPACTDLWLLWGRALLRVGRRQEAETAFRRALALGPPPAGYASTEGAGSWQPLLELAAIAEAGGRHVEALSCYQQVYRAAPAIRQALYRAAALLNRIGRGRRLLAELQAWVRPETADDWLLLADILTVQRQYAQALRCLPRAVGAGADPSEAALLAAFCHLWSGRPDRAEQALGGVPEGHPLAAHAQRMRLQAAWCRKDYRAATLLAAGPEGSAIPAELAAAVRGIHQALCQPEMAGGDGAERWGRAGGELLLETVDVLLAAGQKQEAERLAGLMHRLDWPAGWKAMGMTFQLRGCWRQARHCFRTAVSQGILEADLLCTLAGLELRARQWPEALALVTRAVDLNPNDPTPYLLRARLHRAQAMDLLKRARRRWPDPEIEAMLSRLTREGGE